MIRWWRSRAGAVLYFGPCRGSRYRSATGGGVMIVPLRRQRRLLGLADVAHVAGSAFSRRNARY